MRAIILYVNLSRACFPGHGRWRAIPLDQRNPAEDPWEAEALLTGAEDMAIDADGSIIRRTQLFADEDDTAKQEAEHAMGVILHAQKFKRQLKAAVRVRGHIIGHARNNM